MSSNKENILRQFCDVTGADDNRSKFFLESSNWQLDVALSSFYEHGGNIEEAANTQPAAAAVPQLSDSDMESPPRSPTQPQKKDKKKPANPHFATLDSLQQESSSEDEGEAFYAGGSERSGQQILGPGKGRKDIVTEMFKSVRERGAVVFDEEPSTASRGRGGVFSGVGYRLGQTADDHEQVTPGRTAGQQDNQPRSVRLQLYREGFSVDGGPLRQYADPDNAEFLSCIRRGYTHVTDDTFTLYNLPRSVRLQLYREGFSVDGGPLRQYADPDNAEFLSCIRRGYTHVTDDTFTLYNLPRSVRLQLYREGFSVDGGPLRQYADPDNAEFLSCIRRGYTHVTDDTFTLYNLPRSVRLQLYREGFSVDGGPLRQYADPDNAEFLSCIRRGYTHVTDDTFTLYNLPGSVRLQLYREGFSVDGGPLRQYADPDNAEFLSCIRRGYTHVTDDTFTLYNLPRSVRLQLYREGFSVDGGPLRQYADPDNAEFLSCIRRGYTHVTDDTFTLYNLPRSVRLQLYREGFSVDGGPLRQYADPDNAEFLSCIRRGYTHVTDDTFTLYNLPGSVRLQLYREGFSVDGGPLRQYADPDNAEFLSCIRRGYTHVTDDTFTLYNLPRSVRLQLYREGFSVDGGPLRQYADPDNAEFLSCIRRGEIPDELSGRGEVRLSLEDRRHEDCTRAVAPRQAFSGKGHLLGSPTPATVGQTIAVAATSDDRAANQRAAQDAVALDESSPVTTVQFRLSDGTRLTGRFNHSHTVDDLIQYVTRAEPAYQLQTFALFTTFPSTELTDRGATLAQANLLNTTVLQRLK
ncbi:uncharacterized protein LOC112045549 [Bicyclus anynana]|uniref:Uncharacterized protein LOC112045549 n=1 Tax=Bicyclus anynana TaxID=110368 RepID=A0A6J1MX74_BICAN|nr:uncharacterized protein LOC112045549 [Bicyclus anynana]